MLLNNIKVVAIVPNRMGSSRFPRKNAQSIRWKGHDFIGQDHIAMRLHKVKEIDKVIFAFPETVEDKEFVEKTEGKVYDMNGVAFNKDYMEALTVSGMKEENVIERVLKVALDEEADIIIEITSDCPFIDPKHIKEMLYRLYDEELDYISNVFPFYGNRTLPDGLDVQIYTTEVLEKAFSAAKVNYEQFGLTVPHVGYNILLHKIEIEQGIGRDLDVYYQEYFEKDLSHIGITLDTKEDLDLLRNIAHYYDNYDNLFTWTDISSLFTKHPELLKINENVKRKDFKKDS